MSRPALVILIVLAAAFPLAGADGTSEKAALDSLVARMRELAAVEETLEIFKAKEALAGDFAKRDHQKAAAILFPLLESTQAGVPAAAERMLRECADGLGPEHLDELKRYYHRPDLRLSAGIIASQRTSAATEFLVQDFRSRTRRNEHLEWAIATLGREAVPSLLAGLEKAPPDCEDVHFQGLGNIFRQMKNEERQVALTPLLKMAEDALLRDGLRQGAILTIGSLGDAAEEAFPALRALALREPQLFGAVVDKAIIATRTAPAALLLADQIDRGANAYTIGAIASVGRNARAIGPRVVKWLEHPDWECRVEAARVLGEIGHPTATEPLEKLLFCDTDWRLAFVAAGSLAKLGSKDSLPSLATAERRHWFPTVRSEIARARDVLNGKEQVVASDPLSGAASVRRDELSVETKRIPAIRGSEQVEYGQAFTTFEAVQPDLARRFHALRHWDEPDSLKRCGSLSQVQLKEGLLMGVAAGDWVGGLAFLREDGRGVMLLKEDIHGMVQWRGLILLASGMHHMGSNQGWLKEVRIKEDRAQVSTRFVLPGRAAGMWRTKKDELVVCCLGGTVVFADPTSFKYYSAEGVEGTATVRLERPEAGP